MKAGIKKRWISALRSGKYKQGTGQLRDAQNNFCCLGVLCDVQGRHWWKPEGTGEWTIGVGDQQDWLGPNNEKLIRDIGGYEHRTKLIKMNDSGKSFEQIARYIEQHL